jgi:hypothetical protein
MAAAARRRCAGLSNVEITLCPRGAPPGLAPARFDLAIAVDVFPYIVQCGGDLAGIWFEAVARALAPGGSFVVCNFSYRGDLQADVDQAAALARAGGLRPVRMGARPFRCWDGALFHFERRPPRAQGTTPARGR